MKVDTCPTCEGKGRVYILLPELDDGQELRPKADPMICTECDGTGVPYED